MWAGRGTEACAQLLEPRAAVAAQRRIVGDALGEQQSLDPIDVLPRSPIKVLRSRAVLVLHARRPGHRAHPRFAALESHQRAKQRLPVGPVGLGAPASARGCDRGGSTTWLSIPSFSSAR